MKAIIFVEIDGVKYFKCDTFWSMSPEPHHAKIYSDDNRDQLFKWLSPCVQTHVWTSRKNEEDIKKLVTEWKSTLKKYNNANLGYFIPKDDLYKNQYCLKDETKLDTLGECRYLWTIKIKDENEFKEIERSETMIKYDEESIREFIDYTQVHRDEIIGNILNEKDTN